MPKPIIVATRHSTPEPGQRAKVISCITKKKHQIWMTIESKSNIYMHLSRMKWPQNRISSCFLVCFCFLSSSLFTQSFRQRTLNMRWFFVCLFAFFLCRKLFDTVEQRSIFSSLLANVCVYSLFFCICIAAIYVVFVPTKTL